MAQQTINVGTAPNDGTGTPLRTAFQYTNSNFSELYTAVGPSGNNIVVPGSATITGDLTVDTSTLKVDSANNRVGVGTASPLGPFHLVTTAAGFSEAGYFENSQAVGANVGPRISLLGAGSVAMSLIQSGWNAAANTDAYLAFLTRGTSSVAERYRIASDGVATWSNVGGVAGTAMTLNSTGLIRGASSADIITTESTTLTNIGNIGAAYGTNTGTYFAIKVGAANGIVELKADARTGAYPPIVFTTGATERLRIDSSGNVGIGVTPSAWVSGSPAVQLKYNSSIWAFTDNSIQVNQNAFYDGAWKYINAASLEATNYYQNAGKHIWRNAAAGTAGNAITWTQAMTLDASGNLNLGVTSSLINTTRRLSVSGTVAAALQSTGAATVETINVWHTATSGNNIFVDFDTEAAVTSRGSISYNRAGGLVAYNTTSDYRAKDIIGPVSNSGSLIDSLKVYVGKMKGATIERPMLIAHEAQEVAPYAVTGTKDEVDADGKPKYQQMDASALVPLLIAEIQSLRTRVQTLETR